MYLGVHLDSNHYTSIIEALQITEKLGGNILQVYLGDKRKTTLRYKIQMTKDEKKEIKQFLKKKQIKLVVHAILSLNYCNDPNSMRNQWGIDNLIYDINLCKQLGGIGCVLHMGTHKTKKIDITYDECLTNFVKSIIKVLDNTKKIPILFETPVNRKNIVGGTLEGLQKLFHQIPAKYIKRIKFCIDTQHIFASGYNIRNLLGIEDYFKKFNRLLSLKNLALIHLNDSEKEFFSVVNRHAPIGKGYIFSGKDSTNILQYIVQLSNEYNIPLVLETKFENLKQEIHLLKTMEDENQKKGKEKEIKKGGNKQGLKNKKNKKNKKKKIILILKSILLFHKKIGKKANIQTKYRIDSYEKAIKSLEKYNGKILSAKNVKELPYIGKGFYDKINEICKTGTLQMYENIKKKGNIEQLSSYEIFQNVFGIGQTFAMELIQKKIYTLSQLKKAHQNGIIHLNEQQLLGLKYYNDLKQRIPRNEITEMTDLLKKIFTMDKKYDFIKIINAGSYRMEKESSGDIDIIVSYPEKKITLNELSAFFYDTLNKKKIIVDTLSNGIQKKMYIIKVSNKYKYYRKMDVAFVEETQLPWYLLYFGSSREYSKKIRTIASKLGYKLNEKGLFDKQTGKRIDFYPKTEEDIFSFLKIPFVEPKNRL
jgi:apurinic endonuclease APN1